MWNYLSSCQIFLCLFLYFLAHSPSCYLCVSLILSLSSGGESDCAVRILSLYLLRLILRFLVPSCLPTQQRATFSLATPKPKQERASPANQGQEALYKHLCAIADDNESNADMKAAVEKIILDGRPRVAFLFLRHFFYFFFFFLGGMGVSKYITLSP